MTDQQSTKPIETTLDKLARIYAPVFEDYDRLVSKRSSDTRKFFTENPERETYDVLADTWSPINHTFCSYLHDEFARALPEFRVLSSWGYDKWGQGSNQCNVTAYRKNREPRYNESAFLSARLP